MSRGSTSDIILQGGRKLDLRDRSLSTQDVTALATLLSTSRQVSVLILYNVRLNSDVRRAKQQVQPQQAKLPSACTAMITIPGVGVLHQGSMRNSLRGSSAAPLLCTLLLLLYMIHRTGYVVSQVSTRTRSRAPGTEYL